VVTFEKVHDASSALSGDLLKRRSLEKREQTRYAVKTAQIADVVSKLVLAKQCAAHE
jgi:hypothetical protein